MNKIGYSNATPCIIIRTTLYDLTKQRINFNSSGHKKFKKIICAQCKFDIIFNIP